MVCLFIVLLLSFLINLNILVTLFLYVNNIDLIDGFVGSTSTIYYVLSTDFQDNLLKLNANWIPPSQLTKMHWLPSFLQFQIYNPATA